MNTPEDLQRVDVEKVRGDEKKITMVVALEDRIRQHEAGYRVAQTRITACLELKKTAPAQADVLNGVIDIWMRVRTHHKKVADASRELLSQFKARDPDES